MSYSKEIAPAYSTRNNSRRCGACAPAELVGGELREAGDDAGAGGHGQQLQLHSAHPANRWQIIGHQQVVGLVIEAPAHQFSLDAYRTLALVPHHHLIGPLRKDEVANKSFNSQWLWDKFKGGREEAAPLADDECGARVLALLDHVQEVLLLRLA